MIKADRNTYYRELALYYKNAALMFRNDAAVHLEAFTDEFFWKKVFEHFLPNKTFHFITYSRTRENAMATGSAMCLKYKDIGSLSKDFFVCIDSDYRYLMRERGVNVNNFVFQTYTYSIENHWAYPDGINKVFEKIGLNNTVFDFGVFLKSYSQALYELYIYHLISVSKNDYALTKRMFRSLLNIEVVSLKDNGREMILNIKKKIESELHRLRSLYPRPFFDKVKRYYEDLGINMNNAYLYFRGHNILEQVVMKIAQKIKIFLEKEIGNDLPDEEKEAFFSERKKQTLNFTDNICFDKYPEINKIRNDVQLFFN